MNRAKNIEQILIEELKPSHYEIINESHQHQVKKDAETHFQLIIVSEAFVNLNAVQRHRLVYRLLAEEMAPDLEDRLHALSLFLKSPTEWQEGQKKSSPSPRCRGGFRHG